MPTPTTAHRPRQTDRPGLAMVLVLLALAIAVVSVASFLAAQGTSVGLGRNIDAHARARMIAETGLTTSIAYLGSSDTWRQDQLPGVWLADQDCFGGTFQVMFDDEDGDPTDDPSDWVTVHSLGRFNSVTHAVTARVRQPTGLAVLLVMPDVDHPSAGDMARQAQLEAFGFDPRPISASAGEATILAAAAACDVVYVCQSAWFNGLGDGLVDMEIGVVVEDTAMDDNFGLAAGAGTVATGRLAEVVNNDHFITAPFMTGPLTVHRTDGHVNEIDPALGPGVQMLMQNSGGTRPTLVVVEQGGALIGSAPAAARRALVPWAEDDFAAGRLTSSGLTLLRRSIEWCAGAELSVNAGIAASGIISVGGNGVDSYDSGAGPYGGANVSSLATIATNATDAGAIDISSAVGGDVYVGQGGDPTTGISGSGTVTGSTGTLDTPLQVVAEEPDFDGAASAMSGLTFGTPGGPEETWVWDAINMAGKKTLAINGPVRAIVRGDITWSGQSSLVIAPGASLVIYLEGNLLISGNGWKINEGGEPRQLRVYMLNATTMSTTGNGSFHGVIVGPEATLDIGGNGSFYGAFVGQTAHLRGNAALHQDIALSGVISGSGTATGGAAANEVVWVE